MSNLSDKILKLIKEKDLSYGELSKLTGISKSTLQRYATGETEKIPFDKLENIAIALNTPPEILLGWNTDLVEERGKLPHPDLYPIKTKKWRVLGDISCGEPIYANEDFDSYIEAGADISADFCVRANGDSMINARILDGDIVFIRKQPMVNNGEIAAVIVDEGITLKRFFRHGDTVYLQAENPAYEPLIYNKEELDQIYIIGKAVAFQSDIK